MAKYIKVRPIVAEMIGLADIRPKTADGNYTLWANDLTRLGRVADYGQIVTAIGGVCLHSSDVAKEQRGELSTPLPEITDERIRVWAAEREGKEKQETQEATTEEAAAQTEGESFTPDNAGQEEGKEVSDD